MSRGQARCTAPDRSTRTTSAPMSASIIAANGAGPMPAISTILKPVRGPVMRPSYGGGTRVRRRAACASGPRTRTGSTSRAAACLPASRAARRRRPSRPPPLAWLPRRVILASTWVWISACTLSGSLTSVNRCWPCSPPDSISRSPQPSMRSITDWWKITLLTRSSGISIPCLANTPVRKMIRSLVITKLVVNHWMYRETSRIALIDDPGDRDPVDDLLEVAVEPDQRRDPDEDRNEHRTHPTWRRTTSADGGRAPPSRCR